MGTMRSSFCMLLAVKTRLGWWWTTQISLCFFSWTDSTCRSVILEHWYKLRMFMYVLSYFYCSCSLCRLQKPRPQFSSCAASASTCHRISWPVGGSAISKTTSAHTCQISRDRRFLPQGHWSKLTSYPSQLNRIELVRGTLLFVNHSYSFWSSF